MYKPTEMERYLSDLNGFLILKNAHRAQARQDGLMMPKYKKSENK